MSGINGKVVAITGAGSGIGRATALLLAERGASVALGARRIDRLSETAALIDSVGGQALVCETDVTSVASAENFVASTVERFGRMDVFVGNAGISKMGPVAELDVAGWSAMIDVNLRGVLHGIAAAVPVFREQGGGHLVTTVSTAGLKIVPGMGVYAATKNAVRTLLEALRQESTDGTLRTTAVSPGYVRTDLPDSIDDPVARAEAHRRMAEIAIDPEAVARAIAFAIEQRRDVEVGEIVLRPTVQG